MFHDCIIMHCLWFLTFSFRSFEGGVPYNAAKDKGTRNVFRRFMAAYPDKYDYNEARVSSLEMILKIERFSFEFQCCYQVEVRGFTAVINDKSD